MVMSKGKVTVAPDTTGGMWSFFSLTRRMTVVMQFSRPTWRRSLRAASTVYNVLLSVWSCLDCDFTKAAKCVGR